MIRAAFWSVLVLLGYGFLAAGPHWGTQFTRFLSVYAVLFALCIGAWAGLRTSRNARVLGLILGVAVLIRVPGVLLPPYLSDDIFRYIWDGRVLLSGINPYALAPDHSALAALHDPLWAQINHPELPTIYPPLLQLIFAAGAWISPTVPGFKSLFVLADLGVVWFLFLALRKLGRPGWVVLYAWHPLPVVEIAGSGHAESVGLLLLAVALWAWASQKHLLSGMALALGGMVKFLLWVGLPWFFRCLRRQALWLLLVPAALYGMFWRPGVNPLGSLSVFTAKWRANDFLFGLMAPPGASDTELFQAKLVAAAMVLAVGAWALFRRWEWPAAYVWTAGVALLVSPVVHPWYVLWLLPAAVILAQPALFLWSGTVILAYTALPGYLEAGVWEESQAWKLAEYLPVLTLAAWEAYRTRRGRLQPRARNLRR